MSQYRDDMWNAAEMIAEWDHKGLRFKALSVPRKAIDADDDSQPALMIVAINSGNVREIDELFDPCYMRMGREEKEALDGILSHAPEDVKEFAGEIDAI